MRADVKILADADFLIQVEQRSGSRDVVSFGWLAPRGAILRATGNDNWQAQRHAQRKTSFFILVRSAHYRGHSFPAAYSLVGISDSASISPLRLFRLVPFIEAFASFLPEPAFADHAAQNFRRSKRFRLQRTM